MQQIYKQNKLKHKDVFHITLAFFFIIIRSNSMSALTVATDLLCKMSTFSMLFVSIKNQ